MYRRKRPILRVVIALSSFLFLFLVVELVIRTGISLKWDLLRNPDLYADWTSEELYWKLKHQWGKGVFVGPNVSIDPVIGWSWPKTSKNQLGTVPERSYSTEYDKGAFIFVGDSFVEGETSYADRIPNRLEAGLYGTPVYNFGMAGYGLDQIYLKLQEVLQPFKKPACIVGMATVDLDRSLMSFRTGPKPHFIVQDNELVLRGVPLPKDPNKWFKKYPPTVLSYAYKMFERKLRLLHADNPLELVYLRDEKKLLNSKILEAIVNLAESKSAPLYFVIFYNQRELFYEGWRERFLKSEMQRLSIALIDTKTIFLEESKEPKDLAKYYLPSGLLSAKGNILVASKILEEFKRH